MKKKIRLLALIIALFSASSSLADPDVLIEPYMNDEMITVEKTAPNEIFIGEAVPISIVIMNGVSAESYIELKENFGQAQVLDYGAFNKSEQGQQVISGDTYYKALVKVPGNSKATVIYVIKPRSLGDYMISGTSYRTPLGQSKTNSVEIKVRCNQNNVCETDIGENSFNCEDCKPDMPDLLCYQVRDKVCDPDCSAGEDPDCGSPTTVETPISSGTTLQSVFCGNDVCDSDEDYDNCPVDCRSGSSDGFCDRQRDGICDPDCSEGEDIDCSRSTSWLIIMVFILLILAGMAVALRKKWLKQKE